MVKELGFCPKCGAETIKRHWMNYGPDEYKCANGHTYHWPAKNPPVHRNKEDLIQAATNQFFGGFSSGCGPGGMGSSYCESAIRDTVEFVLANEKLPREQPEYSI